MKFPTDVKPQRLKVNMFSAVTGWVSCGVHCYVLADQSSLSRSFPVSISSALVSFSSLSLVSRTASVQSNKKILTSFFVCFFGHQRSRPACA